MRYERPCRGSWQDRLHAQWNTIRRTILPRPYWGYEDVGIFCLVLVGLSTVFRLAVRSHSLPASVIARPPVILQLVVLILLGTSILLILKIRHRQPVLVPLGLFWPARKYVLLAITVGVALAAAVLLASRFTVHPEPSLPPRSFLFLGIVLGPLLEEIFFRGLLLPLFSVSAGDQLAVIATAVLFAVFHGPTGALQWASLITTGIAYGYLRVVSRTTTAAALAHGTYNLLVLASILL